MSATVTLRCCSLNGNTSQPSCASRTPTLELNVTNNDDMTVRFSLRLVRIFSSVPNTPFLHPLCPFSRPSWPIEFVHQGACGTYGERMSGRPSKGGGMDPAEESDNSENMTKRAWYGLTTTTIDIIAYPKPPTVTRRVASNRPSPIVIHGNIGSRTDVSPLTP